MLLIVSGELYCACVNFEGWFRIRGYALKRIVNFDGSYPVSRDGFKTVVDFPSKCSKKVRFPMSASVEMGDDPRVSILRRIFTLSIAISSR